MKKIFIILIMLVYGLSSSGMTINLHYCCGKLDGVSFSAKHKQGCAKDNEIKKGSCCSDKQVSIKVNSDQATVKWAEASKNFISLPVATVSSISSFTQDVVSIDRLARGTPSDLSSIPLFIKNCVFRI